MKPTKQTVYLPVEITEEFWKKYDNGEKPDYEVIDADTGERYDEWINKQEGYFFTPEQLNQLLSDVIQDTLNTASEKVTYIKECGRTSNEKCYAVFCHNCSDVISKESITNTFEESYQKYKV